LFKPKNCVTVVGGKVNSFTPYLKKMISTTTDAQNLNVLRTLNKKYVGCEDSLVLIKQFLKKHSFSIEVVSEQANLLEMTFKNSDLELGVDLILERYPAIIKFKYRIITDLGDFEDVNLEKAFTNFQFVFANKDLEINYGLGCGVADLCQVTTQLEKLLLVKHQFPRAVLSMKLVSGIRSQVPQLVLKELDAKVTSINGIYHVETPWSRRNVGRYRNAGSKFFQSSDLAAVIAELKPKIVKKSLE
jgi:hypothetical protein